MNRQTLIEVTLLGHFSLSLNGTPLLTDDILSQSPEEAVTLLQYFLANHNKVVSAEALSAILPKAEKLEKSRGYLMYNIVRARDLLKKLGFAHADELIISVEGGYTWNPDRNTFIDAEEFDAIAGAALASDNIDERLSLTKSAMELYAGHFLPEADYELWAVSFITYYKNIYADLCIGTVQQLWDNDRWPDIIYICEHAIKLLPDSEELYIYYIRALAATDKAAAAVEQYEHIRNLLFVNLGVSPSDDLKRAYYEASAKLSGRSPDINTIKSSLTEQEYRGGAYYCEYKVFRNLVRLQARDIARSGKETQLVIITLSGDDHIGPTEIKRLETIMLSNLRTGDAFTRLNSIQFLIMLPGANQQNAKMVFSRIHTAFKKKFPLSKADLRYDYFHLDPADNERGDNL